MKTFFVLGFIFMIPLFSQTQSKQRFADMPREEAAKVLRETHRRNSRLPGRIEALGKLVLGTPYELGPLGEGPEGEFDRRSVISFKSFDCTTLVETVMALALEPDLEQAQATLQKIRYKDGKIRYESRNHFPEADWVLNNIAAGFLQDITREIAGDKTKISSKVIRKRDWYAKKTQQDLRGFETEPEPLRQERLERLRLVGRTFPDQKVSMEYLPIELLPEFLDRIPSGTVVNLVRKDMEDLPVLIRHQVFFVDRGKAKYILHAASGGVVEEVPALQYFYRFFNAKWPVLGLNLNQLQKH